MALWTHTWGLGEGSSRTLHIPLALRPINPLDAAEKLTIEGIEGISSLLLIWLKDTTIPSRLGKMYLLNLVGDNGAKFYFSYVLIMYQHSRKQKGWH